MCPNGCGVPMQETHINEMFQRGDEYVMITNIPAFVCPNCGEESIPTSSVKLIEDVMSRKVAATKVVSAELYDSALIASH
jgi:YgiT-type zinc finger domain-containing protein